MLTPPLNTELINIFFDESGQDSDKPSTMGGLMIPQSVYMASEFTQLTKQLKSGVMKLHWKEYTGDSTLKTNILNAIRSFSLFARYTNMNIINYNRSLLDARYKFSEHPGSKSKSRRERQHTIDYATLMVYTKIPERIFYGLLRHYGKDLYIKTNIYIEKEGKYEKYDLEKRLIENLNTQSLYRAEQYWIEDCKMVPKGEMIGVELVDLLLGIVRLIISNKPVPLFLTDEEYKAKQIKGLAKKNELVIELLQISEFYNFLANIKYYEWDSQKQLNDVSFKNYMDLYMAKNFRSFSSW